MKFCEKLLYLRKCNKLSQEQLADMLEVSRQSVSKWESGQTYPEMDKLLMLCKIFKTDLEELTNDDIKISSENKSKNYITSFIDEFLLMVDKSITMFKNMSQKQIITFIIEAIILLFVISLFQIPFEYFSNLPLRIFDGFNNGLTRFIINLWRMIMDLIAFVISIVIIGYVYKTRYLDNFNKDSINVKIVDNEQDIEVKREKEMVERRKKHSDSPLLNILGAIFNVFFKFLAVMFAFPFLMMTFGLIMAFVMLIILLFKGVIYFGLIIILLFLTILSIFVIELVFNFIFNKNNNLRRLFLTLIIGIIGLGIGSGIFTMEIASTEYINGIPSHMVQTEKEETIKMNKDLFVPNYYYNLNVEYKVNNELTDSLIINAKYYKDFTNIQVEVRNNQIILDDTYFYDVIQVRMLKQIVKDLKNKKLYNYNNFGKVNLIITGSENNINILKENYQKYIDNESERHVQNMINNYERRISELQTRINELERNYSELEFKYNYDKDQYLMQIEEYKNKINELKNIID